jgi:hypothetical protein
MNVGTVAEQLFFVTANLEARGPAGTANGTGFIYSVETNRGTAHFLVTNKHVLDAANPTLLIQLIAGTPDGRPDYGQTVKVLLTDTPSTRIDHPNPGVDVSLVPFSNVLSQLPKAPFFKSIPESVALTPRLAEETVDALEEVIFVGYPNNIFDSTNFTPVARSGMTATPIAIDFDGLPMFLIDASVFPGSSGSPVFLFDKSGSFMTKQGGVQIGGRFIFLGVLSAVVTRTVEGTVVQLPTRSATQFAEPIDLGIVFKASVLTDIVDPLLASAGLTRVAPSGLEPGAETDADVAIAEAVAEPDANA